MAEFNPDEYLAKKPTTTFNPDEYLGLAPSQPTQIRQPQELTTGQKVYQNIRNIAAPTLEAAGAIGGGLLGTPLGPAGIVGGAGLGYGIAKEAINLGDIYLGGQAPRQGAGLFTEPAKNILEGATYEVGGRLAGPLIQKGVNKVFDIGATSQLKAANIARESLGKDLPNVLEKLKNAPQNASVAEITASFDNPTWQALIKEALDRDPQFLRKIRLFGEDESLKALSKLAGGENAAEVRSVLDNAKKALNQMTTPQREAALKRANLGQAVADYEAQAGKLSSEAAAKVQEVRRLIELGDVAAAAARLETIKAGLPASSRLAPAKSQAGFSDEFAAKFTYPGKLAQMSDEWASQAANASLDLGQGARFAQGAADAMKSVGIKPLEGNQLSKNIANIGNNPSFAGDDVLLGAIKNVSDDIAKWTSSGGIIDARALDAIRKNSVNAAIAQLRPGIDATSQRNLASSVLSDIKPALIDAIEASGGSGYRQYLTDYTKGMQKIAERKLSGEALRLWKTNKDEFVRLVQNESPEEVEKILGKGKYNIATELADNTLSVLREQADKRLTQLSVQQQVSEGQKALTQLLKQQTSMVRLPSWFSFWASAANKTVSELEKAIGNKSMKILTDAMKNPQAAADLLNTLPKNEKQRITTLLTDPNSIRTMAQQATEE
jgi:hypothetical protein